MVGKAWGTERFTTWHASAYEVGGGNVCVRVCIEDSAVYVIYVNDMYVSVCESALGDYVCYC